MLTVPVELGPDSYDILIEPGLLRRAAAYLPVPTAGRPLVIVTDETVAERHLPALCEAVEAETKAVVLPAGEATKSWASLERVVEELLDLGVERGDSIVALGGGVVGDLTGFAAAILRRGCGFVQVPTTLLAQVDSSVGGKTAINAAAGKNLVGAFHQPRQVLIDPEVLATLPTRQLRAGYAEVVKYGLIGDEPFFAWCEANHQTVLAGKSDALSLAIETSCRAKAAIVAEDERETSGRRALLNLGHTFGHALEAELGFSDALLHGEAVAIGMRLAFAYSARLGLCGVDEAERVETHLLDAGLPVRIPPGIGSAEALVAHMRQDKKAKAGAVPLILARGIGEAFVWPEADLTDVHNFLTEELRGK
ncbi:3-dehydroquinate synthase [Pacificimonas flava]|uniref:3-dehydroquinate synthase n=2 Tax=Pacificimonas TaxID=1960290 RepID=A0A219B2M8_9SPHN|nr:MULTISPECIES: 3-dehydroquinate synthase [Pacificimonas]MBZ6377966.1 3-dehydroquinate synthase [Pacificimonas aurantium]OWV32383.1 3-dehydroquinate synthase [Pacificimonas flava]